jgi:hypothetical protein
VLWICLAVALVPVLVLFCVTVSVWGKARALFREVGGLPFPSAPDHRR